MTSPRALLAEAGLSPKKSFGQNFLVDAHVTMAIARACVPDDEVGRARVVEIGAGTGALTALLLARAEHVIAVERDRDLVPLLETSFAAQIAERKLEVLEADAARADYASLLAGGRPRVLAGNLPYQITGKLIELSCSHAASLDRAIFMVQREVADRLTAEPDGEDYGALTVFVRAAFDVSRVMQVSRGSFFPQPNVDSAVVRLSPRVGRVEETEAFRALVKAAFSQRRKTLRNAWGKLASREVLERVSRAAGVTLDARGETMSADAFGRAAAALEGEVP